MTETNIIEILSVVDSAGNKWYEVDYLAQDKVPVETHYTDDWANLGPSENSRDNAYKDVDNSNMITAVPYSLEYIQTPKRFVTEVDENNKTSLVFGNGILNTSTTGSLQSGFLQTKN